MDLADASANSGTGYSLPDLLTALGVAKNDRGCSQHRTAKKEREIGQKQWQQHEGEAAKHRYPILHPFAVSENDEAEGAENYTPNAIRGE
jgi:hypothetical protein